MVMSLEKLQELLYKARNYQTDFEFEEMEYVLALLLYTNLYLVPHAKLKAVVEGSSIEWKASPYSLILGVMLTGMYKTLAEFSAVVVTSLRRFILFAGESDYKVYLCRVVVGLYEEFVKEIGQKDVGKWLYEIISLVDDIEEMKRFFN